MLKHFETTSLILLWCVVFSLAIGFFRWKMINLEKPPRAASRFALPIVPALVLGPLAILLAWRVFDVNLIYPVHLLSELSDLSHFALVPALVLILASGLAVHLWRKIGLETQRWQSARFLLLAKSVGKNPRDQLRPLVLRKSFLESWSAALPWLFGELMVVEAVFNAPGVGLDVWHRARTRDVEGFVLALISLVAMYVLLSMLLRWLHLRLGRKLEGWM